MSGWRAELAAAGVRLPARASAVAGETGVIVDADDWAFATIDVEGVLRDETVDAIVAAIVAALNEHPRERGTAREAPTAASSGAASSASSAAPNAIVPRPKIDLRTAPSAMETRFGGGRR